jgi:hypothetical protein
MWAKRVTMVTLLMVIVSKESDQGNVNNGRL